MISKTRILVLCMWTFKPLSTYKSKKPIRVTNLDRKFAECDRRLYWIENRGIIQKDHILFSTSSKTISSSSLVEKRNNSRGKRGTEAIQSATKKNVQLEKMNFFGRRNRFHRFFLWSSRLASWPVSIQFWRQPNFYGPSCARKFLGRRQVRQLLMKRSGWFDVYS
jgi:hypothetical protein